MSELDGLLAAAREAEPAPLGAAQIDALVTKARQHLDRSTFDRVLEDARQVEPAPLTERELRSMAERAAMTGRARHHRWTRQRVMMASALAATVAAAAVTLVVARSAPAPIESADFHDLISRPEPTNLDLPTGDRLVAASGAHFQVELPEPRVRRVRLDGGSMLFDVQPIDHGRFSVSTPNGEVMVLGTVFSVRATEQATTVWVYEGRVRVQGPDGARVVSGGGIVHIGAGVAGEDELAVAGRAAAARRAGPLASIDEPLRMNRISTAHSETAPASTEVVVRHRATREHQGRRARRAELEEPPGTAEPTPAEARTLIASGHADRALAIAEDAIRRGATDPWRMLEGDALRVLGRFGDAAEAYRRAAEELAPPRRQQAGFLEARVRMGQLNDAPGALRALRAAEVTASGSVLRERGMVLEVHLLARLGRRAEAAGVAREYLGAYPEGPDAERMRRYGTSPEPVEREAAPQERYSP